MRAPVPEPRGNHSSTRVEGTLRKVVRRARFPRRAKLAAAEAAGVAADGSSVLPGAARGEVEELRHAKAKLEEQLAEAQPGVAEVQAIEVAGLVTGEKPEVSGMPTQVEGFFQRVVVKGLLSRALRAPIPRVALPLARGRGTSTLLCSHASLCSTGLEFFLGLNGLGGRTLGTHSDFAV